MTHLRRFWHLHLSLAGLTTCALTLALGFAAATFHFRGGFRPGPMAPSLKLSGPPLPASVSLAPFLTRIHNQGYSSSCVGQTLSTLTEITQAERHRRYHFSAGFIYDQSNGGVDQGTTYQAAFTILLSEGDDRLRVFPHDGIDFLAQPTPSEIALARPYRFSSWRSIAPADRYTMEAELAHGRPFALAIPVYDSFYFHTGSAPITAATGQFHFRHSITAIGYSPAGLRILNSWGPAWGQNGQATLTWNLLPQLGAEIAIATPNYQSLTPRKNRGPDGDTRTGRPGHPPLEQQP